MPLERVALLLSLHHRMKILPQKGNRTIRSIPLQVPAYDVNANVRLIERVIGLSVAQMRAGLSLLNLLRSMLDRIID